MSGDKKFPADPFWDYSLAVYGKPDVANACLYLQDEFGLDVNLLLDCLWSAAQGPGRLDSGQIREVLNRTRDWQEKIVKPLRNARRFCKLEPVEVPDELRRTFRPALQAVELDAEHVEQLLISRLLREFAAKGGASRGTGADAIQNLLAYLALQGVAVEGEVAQRLTVIVEAAFPGTDPGALGGSAG
jgi:uncharacterized protein (TIGR02444 family)